MNAIISRQPLDWNRAHSHSVCACHLLRTPSRADLGEKRGFASGKEFGFGFSLRLPYKYTLGKEIQQDATANPRIEAYSCSHTSFHPHKSIEASQSGQRQPKIGSTPIAECAQLLRFEIASHRSTSTAAVHAATALAPVKMGLVSGPNSLQFWHHQACHTARSLALSRPCCRSAANLPSRARHRCHFCSPTCRIGTAAAGWPRRRPRCDCPATGSVPTVPPCMQ